ncbi:uncharacterized protein F4822DRAFT_379672 [Hypoxylon trugodes]|uniref:uncharacterized protein n=1 Tax=Hypoxylon trugodes TaxID=326681 RepID=UPI00219C579A|nr:uncharacterized protein F4822DRAFT_379672 [Hypoxylon trugodes]KAI1384982.1 hypothetical protein F4822DRAFT_379672 [Hypoxylon trugodes]
MSHSPLFRTSMRLRLDNRCIALVNYELALEEVNAELEQPPPNTRNFDDELWASLRKEHETKRIREGMRRVRDRVLFDSIKERRKTLKGGKVWHVTVFHQAWISNNLGRHDARNKAIYKSGFAEWRPPLLLENLWFEQTEISYPSNARVYVGESGILDPRLLRRHVTPEFVPRPHFKNERKRLAGKYIEFAEFAAKNAHIMPRPQDLSSDEGLLSEDEEDSTDTPSKKRKRGKTVIMQRTRKPNRFIKLYDCKVHDRTQLELQAMNQFSLMQQMLPRVESPAIERDKGTTIKQAQASPIAEDVEEDHRIEELRTHGVRLPTRYPYNEVVEGEEEQQKPTVVELAMYRAWRRRQRHFFDDRDSYMQNRIYYEQVHERDLLRAGQDLMAFWAKVNT